MLRHGRQEGMSTVIAIHIANMLCDSVVENKKIALVCPTLAQAKGLKDIISEIIDDCVGDGYVETWSDGIRVGKNNLQVFSDNHMFNGEHFDSIIVDGAHNCKFLRNNLPTYYSISTKMILCGDDEFSDNYFNHLWSGENGFYKVKLTERKESKESLSTKTTAIEQPISFKMNTELLSKLALKLIREDITFSNYVNSLIEKDLI